MIKKAALISELEKARRKLFIWENIGVGINASVKEKEIASKKFLDENPDYNLYEVSDTIKINKGTLYHYLYTRVEKPWFVKRVEELTIEVIRVFEASKRIYGAEKIVAALKKDEIITDKKTVLKIMRNNNLVKVTVSKRKKLKFDRAKRNYYRNLLKQHFNPDAPNKVWVSDFFEIDVRGAKYHLCAIMDLFARKIIAWRISHKQNDNLAIMTLKDAFESRNEPMDLIFHTDQGIEFKSNKFKETIAMMGIRQSFSCSAYPNDNACIEGFFSRLRSEEVNVNIDKYENSKVMKQYLTEYFNRYNNERVHSYNDGMPPNEKEDEWFKNHSS